MAVTLRGALSFLSIRYLGNRFAAQSRNMEFSDRIMNLTGLG